MISRGTTMPGQVEPSHHRFASAALRVGLALALGGCATAFFEVDDAVELEDGRIRFAAFTERDQSPFFGGYEGVEVRFQVDGADVASARSDDRGVATTLARIEPGAERFEASARYGGQDFRRAGKIVHWASDGPVVVCDIDATISDTALKALFFDETDEKSEPIAHSADVLHQIAQHHGLVYFTARPKFTVDKTQRWLETHGFPDGPVLTSLTVGDLIAQRRYKRRELRKLREMFPNVLIGIGNSHVDSEGYGANGMLSLIVNRKADTKYAPHEVEFNDWRQVGQFFEANREMLGNAERLHAAIRGDEMAVVPLLQFADPAEGQ